MNNIDPSGHSAADVAGMAQYTQQGVLNELRAKMTAATLWGAQVSAQNSFNCLIN